MTHLAAGGSRLAFGGVNFDVGEPDKLRWAPPDQTDPTIVQLGVGFYEATFAADEDVILRFPADTPRLSIISTTGGRHVRVIGGKGTGSSGGRVYLRELTGSAFFEGLHLDMTDSNGADALVACGVRPEDGTETTPDIYIQNCLIENVESFEGRHADAYQPQGPIGALYVDRLTVTTDYQGLYLEPDWNINSVEIHRANFSELASISGTFLYFQTNPLATVYPVTIADVWCSPLNAKLYPIGAISGNHRKVMTWDVGATGITGAVVGGRPPEDFVTAADVGIGYVSPGYRS